MKKSFLCLVAVLSAMVMNAAVMKIIENGQLLIIRDGVRYNAIGNRL